MVVYPVLFVVIEAHTYSNLCCIYLYQNRRASDWERINKKLTSAKKRLTKQKLKPLLTMNLMHWKARWKKTCRKRSSFVKS